MWDLVGVRPIGFSTFVGKSVNFLMSFYVSQSATETERESMIDGMPLLLDVCCIATLIVACWTCCVGIFARRGGSHTGTFTLFGSNMWLRIDRVV